LPNLQKGDSSYKSWWNGWGRHTPLAFSSSAASCVPRTAHGVTVTADYDSKVVEVYFYSEPRPCRQGELSAQVHARNDASCNTTPATSLLQ
jgi:hypothetical protein